MVAVQTEGLGDLAHIAGIRVALEVVGDVHTHQVMGVLHAGQADTGADAVAQCNIQWLLFLFGFRRLVGCFASVVSGFCSAAGLRKREFSSSSTVSAAAGSGSDRSAALLQRQRC